jgi:bacterioferritin
MNPKASEKLTDLLQRAIAGEMQAAIQYMWQHVCMVGLEAEAVGPALRGIAMSEMKHAEQIAERLNYLGGIPTTKPNPIYVGGAIPAMLAVDVTAEEDTIALYMDVIAQAKEDDDHETSLMFREMILDEQGHHNTLLTLLGRKSDVGEVRIGD